MMHKDVFYETKSGIADWTALLVCSKISVVPKRKSYVSESGNSLARKVWRGRW